MIDGGREILKDAGVKCDHCGGRLEGLMAFCPFCGVRQNVDLRQVNFHDLGQDEALPCPTCKLPLHSVEFEIQPPIRIEHCTTCMGLFFNPGEIEVLLESQTNPLVWLDNQQLDQMPPVTDDAMAIVYRKCPICSERMSPYNFGARSGVILDRCGIHGFWLDGGELHRIIEWWRVGGKLIYQEAEQKKAHSMYAPHPAVSYTRPRPSVTDAAPSGGVESMDQLEKVGWGGVILAALVELLTI